MNRITLFLFTVLGCIKLDAQVAKDQVLRVTSKIVNDKIELSWPAEAYTGTYTIYKKQSYDVNNWGANPIAVVPGNNHSYLDVNCVKGERYEYVIIKSRGSTTDALGYISVGNFAKEETVFGSLILLVDSNYRLPLSNEINRYVNDLNAEGWKVYMNYVGRDESVTNVKTRIVGLCGQDSNIKVLVLLGNIPVPYSGYYSSTGDAPPPDGHVEGSGNHTGAWPADVYYGILDNVFTDISVNCTTGSQQRNHNVPGDGKFDQTKLPSLASLEVGRIDLTKLPAFGKSDTLLTKEYLDRNHNWRTGKWKVVERALIDNNFTNLNLASTGYANFTAIIGIDSVFDNRDYMTSQKNGSYLFSYGCGAGSYTSCSGIGNTNNFVNDSFENVFTILAGSYFGDWDVSNNFLRAPLASSSLVSFWGGIPKWYIHHMGIGERIGKGTKITQNNTGFYFTGNFNYSQNSMHIALMGDPTLKIRNLPTVNAIRAQSQNNFVYLNWDKLDSFEYAVYRFDTISRKFTRLNTTPTRDTFYVDSFNFSTGNYVYAVKCIQLEYTASGCYYNTGGAAYTNVYHINSDGGVLKLSDEMINIYPNPSNGQFSVSFENKILNADRRYTFKIFDMNGRCLFKQDWNNLTADIHVDIGNVPNGLYYLELESENGATVARKKIVIQR